MGMSQHKIALARAALPEIMFAPDVAIALRISEDAACEAMARGDCGPFLRFEGHPLVLRETFLRHIEQRQQMPGPRLVEGEAP